MTSTLDHDILENALKRAGSTWNAAQTHGLMSGRLAVQGAATGPEWLAQVMDGADAASASGKECEGMLVELLQTTRQQFAERLSQFAPLLPDDSNDTGSRTEALALWCEGYLHGLVSVRHEEAIAKQLAAEPVAGIIKDLLAVTQATAGEENADDDDEEAYVEVVEYVRVAAQLVYEELSEPRTRSQK